MDTVIRLDGWSKSRRCLLVRRPAKEKPEAKPARRPRGRPRKNAVVPVQQEFEFVECAKGRAWDCYALVTNDSGLDPVALTQLYRDRGDCENNFDEYKNQWGWCGFVTQKIKPTRAMARLIAIVANWWNVFCRLAEGGRHMEAVTSRPMLMGVVGRIVESGRKRYMHLRGNFRNCSAVGIRPDLGADLAGRVPQMAGRKAARPALRRRPDPASAVWLTPLDCKIGWLEPAADRRAVGRASAHAT